MSTLQTFSFPLDDALPPRAAHRTVTLVEVEGRWQWALAPRTAGLPPHAPRHGGCMLSIGERLLGECAAGGGGGEWFGLCG